MLLIPFASNMYQATRRCTSLDSEPNKQIIENKFNGKRRVHPVYSLCYQPILCVFASVPRSRCRINQYLGGTHLKPFSYVEESQSVDRRVPRRYIKRWKYSSSHDFKLFLFGSLYETGKFKFIFPSSNLFKRRGQHQYATWLSSILATENFQAAQWHQTLVSIVTYWLLNRYYSASDSLKPIITDIALYGDAAMLTRAGQSSILFCFLFVLGLKQSNLSTIPDSIVERETSLDEEREIWPTQSCQERPAGIRVRLTQQNAQALGD